MFLVSLLLIVGMFLGPFYVLPSGNPQPADGILVLWMALTLGYLLVVNRGILPIYSGYRTLILFLLLTVWICAVSVVNGLIFGDPSILFPSLFYVYNFSIFLALLTLPSVYHEKFKSVALWAIVACGMGLLISLGLNFEFGSSRQTGAFNNPNQLGFFSLLLACGLVVVFSAHQLGILFFTLFTVSIIGVLSSSSLTSLGAFVFVLAGAAIKYWRTLFSRSVLIFAVSASLLLSLSIYALGEQLGFQAERRLNVIERKTENVHESRGYTRITEFPEYVIFGAGERGRWRFGSEHSREIHSSLGTIIFSYGVIGLVLFLALMFSILYRLQVYAQVLFLAPMAYSLTHMGLRTTMFWIFLALLMLFSQRKGRNLCECLQ